MNLSAARPRPRRADRLVATAAVALLAAPVLAQCQGVWVQMPVVGPPAHQEGAMSFDPSTQEVLFLHPNGSSWTWNGVRWLDRAEPDQPPREAAAMCVDGVRPRVLLAGGASCCGVYREVLVWEPGWRYVADIPSNRLAPSMGYDPVSDVVIYFGGAFNGYSGTTHGWDGTSWTTLATTGPSPRAYAAAATDPVRGRFMLFGGESAPVIHDDLWEWTGTAWSPVPQPGVRPSPRRYAAAVGTPQGFFLFGGGYVLRGDTWLFAAGQWSQLATTGPSPRAAHAMAYDPIRNHVVLFGGRIAETFVIADDTWVWSALPVLTAHPSSIRICPNISVQFMAPAIGSGAITYQWQAADSTAPSGWIDLTDGPLTRGGQPVGVISGAQTSTLTVDAVVAYIEGLTGSFRCVVSNACGAVISHPALHTICVADLNCDGEADFNDYLEFLNLYNANDPRVDFNADAVVDFNDYLEFLNLYNAGC